MFTCNPSFYKSYFFVLKFFWYKLHFSTSSTLWHFSVIWIFCFLQLHLKNFANLYKYPQNRCAKINSFQVKILFIYSFIPKWFQDNTNSSTEVIYLNIKDFERNEMQTKNDRNMQMLSLYFTWTNKIGGEWTKHFKLPDNYRVK